MPDLNLSHSDQDGSSNSTGIWNSNTGSHQVGTVQNNVDPAFAKYGIDTLGLLSGAAQPNGMYLPQLQTGTNASLFNAGLGPGAGYTPLTGTGTPVTAGQISSTDLTPYMNKYDDAVIQTNDADIDRVRQQQQQTNMGDAETAGAHGGAREVLLMGETNRGAADTAAKYSAQLRSQGFTNAQTAAASDIGTRLTADQFNQTQDYQRRAADEQAALTAAGIRQQASGTLLSAAQAQDPLTRLATAAGISATLPKNTSTGADTSNVSSGYGYGNNQGTQSQSGTSESAGINL